MTKTLTSPTCTPCILNPAMYEIPSSTAMNLNQAQELAVTVCMTCPLIRTCSRYAVDVLHGRRGVQQLSWEGLIIAGVPTPANPRRDEREAALIALEAVAAGHDLEAAHAMQAAALEVLR